MTDASSNKPMNEIAAAAATLQFYLFIYLFWLGVRGGDIGGSRDDGRLGLWKEKGKGGMDSGEDWGEGWRDPKKKQRKKLRGCGPNLEGAGSTAHPGRQFLIHLQT